MNDVSQFWLIFTIGTLLCIGVYLMPAKWFSLKFIKSLLTHHY